ncbi:hypothetical protein IE991_31980 [Klebsiella pneumoniae]|uniref:Uncharacterized protein n=1 Tax=Klebsiella pneumoniae TaxID=573 RepID=A0A927HJQ2_KLEPN|nr:hypothetical protein [Klebsiella pneumoniae]
MAKRWPSPSGIRLIYCFTTSTLWKDENTQSAIFEYINWPDSFPCASISIRRARFLASLPGHAAGGPAAVGRRLALICWRQRAISPPARR